MLPRVFNALALEQKATRAISFMIDSYVRSYECVMAMVMRAQNPERGRS